MALSLKYSCLQEGGRFMKNPKVYQWGQLVVAASFVFACNWYQSHYDIYGNVTGLLQPKVIDDLSTGDFRLKPADEDENKDETLSKIEQELKKQRQVASSIKIRPRSQAEVNRDQKMEEENQSDNLKIRLIKAD